MIARHPASARTRVRGRVSRAHAGGDQHSPHARTHHAMPPPLTPGGRLRAEPRLPWTESTTASELATWPKASFRGQPRTCPMPTLAIQGHPGPAAASFLLHARASGPEEDLPHANTESWNSD